jgi:hypothetical protein
MLVRCHHVVTLAAGRDPCGFPSLGVVCRSKKAHAGSLLVLSLLPAQLFGANFLDSRDPYNNTLQSA